MKRIMLFCLFVVLIFSVSGSAVAVENCPPKPPDFVLYLPYITTSQVDACPWLWFCP